MAAKSRPALSALSAAFSQREVKKTYLALVCGRCPLLPPAALACALWLHAHARGRALVLPEAFRPKQVPLHEHLRDLGQAPNEALVLARCHGRWPLAVLLQR